MQELLLSRGNPEHRRGQFRRGDGGAIPQLVGRHIFVWKLLVISKALILLQYFSVLRILMQELLLSKGLGNGHPGFCLGIAP